MNQQAKVLGRSYHGPSYNMNKPVQKTQDDLEWDSYWDLYQKEALAAHRKRGGGGMILNPERVRDQWTLDRRSKRLAAERDANRNYQGQFSRGGPPVQAGMNTGQNRYRSR